MLDASPTSWRSACSSRSIFKAVRIAGLSSTSKIRHGLFVGNHSAGLRSRHRAKQATSALVLEEMSSSRPRARTTTGAPSLMCFAPYANKLGIVLVIFFWPRDILPLISMARKMYGLSKMSEPTGRTDRELDDLRP